MFPGGLLIQRYQVSKPGGLAVPSLPVLWDLIWLPTCLGWVFSIWGLLLTLPLAWEFHKAEALAVGPTCLVLCSNRRPPPFPTPSAWVPMLTDGLIHMYRETRALAVDQLRIFI